MDSNFYEDVFGALPEILEYRDIIKQFPKDIQQILYEKGIELNPSMVKYVPRLMRNGEPSPIVLGNLFPRPYFISKWYYNIWEKIVKKDPKIMMDNIEVFETLDGCEDLILYAIEKVGIDFLKKLYHDSDDIGDNLEIYFKKHKGPQNYYEGWNNEFELRMIEIVAKNDPQAIIYIIPMYDYINYSTTLNCDTQYDIDYVKKSKILFKNSVERDGLSLELIKYNYFKTFELCKIAIKQNPLAIKYVPFPNDSPIDEHDIHYVNFSMDEYKLLHEYAVIYAAMSKRFPLLVTKLVVTQTIQNGNIIICNIINLRILYEYIYKSYLLPQLNLLQITANSHEI